MRIVVLDGHTLNPGDLSWGGLEALGPCTIYDRTSPAEIVTRAADYEIVVTNKVVLSREVIQQLPHLRCIVVTATGYNIVDIDAARERNVPVTNVPAYAGLSVPQMVFAHLLHLALHVADHGRGVTAGRWTESRDFCYWDFPLVELAGLTMGIVGFGRIGQTTAAIAQAFGMEVLASDVILPPTPPSSVRFISMEELFRQSDVVSLHCPLTATTRHLINAQRLAIMKPTAYLINTSRGPLVDEEALAEALNTGRLAGAGLDVLSAEPPSADNPLLAAKNCCITPHIAWATRAARQRLLDVTVTNIQAFLTGKLQNVVNLGTQTS